LKAKKKDSAADATIKCQQLKLPGLLFKALSKMLLAAGLTQTASYFRNAAVA
jgi:hypothetical protein